MSEEKKKESAKKPDKDAGPGWFAGVRGFLGAAFLDNAGLKFVAFVLALTVFVLVHSDEDEIYHPWVRVTYSELGDRVLTSERVDQVQVTVRGSRRRIKRMQRERLESIRVDLDQLSSGELRLVPELFDLPDGVELISVHPPSISLQFEDRIEKVVPVRVDTVGIPARGFKLAKVQTTPEQVRISGARSRLASLDSVSTQAVNLEGRTQSFKGPVPVATDRFQLVGAKDVNVSIGIVEDYHPRKLAPREIEVRATDELQVSVGARFEIEPREVTVTLVGNLKSVEAIDESAVKAFIVLEQRDLNGGGARNAKVEVEPDLADIFYKVEPAVVGIRPVGSRLPIE